MQMVYITGDTHRDFDRVFDFCEDLSDTTTDDVLVILGDVAINFYGDYTGAADYVLKTELAELPITLLCIHGNHEMRPESISTYEEIEWRGGVVYWEPEFPNLLFAKDGEIYDLEGKRCIAIGGADSIDKYSRTRGLDWWDDEQPSDEIKSRVEERLEEENWRVDVVFSHTCPFQYQPRETFIFNIDDRFVDKSTEEWLDTIEKKLSYSEWYCGHFHTDCRDNNIIFMFTDFRDL